jgi:ATP-dependent DNA helicase RecG
MQARFLQVAVSFHAAQTRARVKSTPIWRSASPMHRLVQGDVGCGKTAVAAAAAALALAEGRQVAFMAPTELLAQQHARTLTQWFTPLGIPVVLVTSSQPARARRTALAGIAAGQIPLAVGTHALFQESMEFQSLALVIIDEQHRCGAQQRLQLRDKGRGAMPHQLIMTATPIPRTLAMTAYADLDISVIDELPPGRTPVRTVVVRNAARKSWHASRRPSGGGQAYWVCALIEESEELPGRRGIGRPAHRGPPQVRVGLCRRLSGARKETVMRALAR